MNRVVKISYLLAAAAMAASLITCKNMSYGPDGSSPPAKTPVAAPAPAPATPAPVAAASSGPLVRPDIPFFNAKLPLEKRLDDLLARLTLDEKANQMQMAAPAIERLGIYSYHWWNESLHGVAHSGTATVFPQAIGMAATWNVDLHHEMAHTIAVEARAKHNEALQRGNHGQYTGLDMWSPNINIFRDPRWGRGQETYGEDPYLTGRFGVAFVTGLQGDDPFYFETIATPKHYAVHSGPEPERHRFNVVPSEQDLYTTYLPAFEASVREGHAFSVMAAYNAVDGLPASANPRLLNDILRKDWGFTGYVVSDVDAVRDVWQSHVTTTTPEKAAAISVQAGCDLNGGTTYRSLANAVRQGLITEKELDVSLRRLFEARIRMGEFDPAGTDPYASIPPSANDSPEHDHLALEVARQSMVLLKNENHVLPLKKDIGSIAVIGPAADAPVPMFGNYNGVPSHPVTIAQGIRNAVPASSRVMVVPGCPIVTEEVALAEPVSTNFLYTDASLKNHGLVANYARNITTSDRLVRGRIDPTINLAYPEQLGRDPLPYTEGIYAKWTGVLVPPDTGDYQIGFAGKDSFRLYLDGKPVVDQFYAGVKRTSGYAVHLEKGKSYALMAEFIHPAFDTALAATQPAAVAPATQVAQSQPSFTGATPANLIDDTSLQLRWTRPTAEGLAGAADGQNLYADAITAAKSADAVVMVLGITSALEREQQSVHYVGFSGGDRTSLDLPLVQERLLEQVTAAANGKPVILVLMNGSALSVNWANDHVPAIVEAWYPGQHGDAVADVIFGNYNPAGRLPVTFYKSVDDLPEFADYDMKSRTYRYFNKPVLYPFGYGLSYTTFAYSDMEIGHAHAQGQALARVTVKNSGAVAGDDVVQCYIDRDGADGMPRKTLVGFQRVSLKPNEQKTVQFNLTPYQLATVNADGKRVLTAGNVKVRIGPNSVDGESQTLTVDAGIRVEFGFAAPSVK